MAFARALRSFRSFVLLALVLAPAAAGYLLPGCRAIESGADSLADATRGSAVSGLFRGVARSAEGFRDCSPSEEHFIGRSVAAEILTGYKVHDDPQLSPYGSHV